MLSIPTSLADEFQDRCRGRRSVRGEGRSLGWVRRQMTRAKNPVSVQRYEDHWVYLRRDTIHRHISRCPGKSRRYSAASSEEVETRNLYKVIWEAELKRHLVGRVMGLALTCPITDDEDQNFPHLVQAVTAPLDAVPRTT